MQLSAHTAAKVRAMLLVRAVYLYPIELILAAKEFEMGACLPSASEKAQDLWFLRSEILCADYAQGRYAHFLNNAVGHDRDWLDMFEIEEDDEPAIAVA